jgi:hypothetical protein
VSKQKLNGLAVIKAYRIVQRVQSFNGVAAGQHLAQATAAESAAGRCRERILVKMNAPFLHQLKATCAVQDGRSTFTLGAVVRKRSRLQPP